jgi:hypothetical protein
MQEHQRTVPPYVPYRSFRNFLEILREGIPARIDRSVWGQRVSGGSGIQLMTALRVLGLIDQNGRPGRDLESLVNSEGDARRQALRAVLERFYAPVFRLDLDRATRAQFHEAFRAFGTKEGVLVKCEAFFIQAAQDAGVELSPFILARRHGARRQASPPRPRSASADRPAQQQPPAQPQQAARNSVAELVLAKYPEFDPGWAPEVQARWLEGMTKLYEGLSRADAQPDE